MTNYVLTLIELVPNARISYMGNDLGYSDIEWLDTRPQPTQAECDAAWPQIEYDFTYAQVQRQRQARYLEETDGLFFDAMRGNQDLTAWTLAVEAIKADLPYPDPIG